MAYLVTGGTGFLGSQVAEQLVERRDDVILFDFAPAPERIADFADEVTFVKGDVRQVEQLARVFVEHDIEAVAHLASALTGTCDDEPPLAMSINAVGTANLLEMASIHNADRVAFASSLAAYGYVGHDDEVTVDEDSPRWPSNLYGSTKVLKEDMGKHYAERDDLSVFSLRFAAIFGPGRAGGTPVVHLQDLFEKPARGDPVTVTGADLRMNWIYVEDAAGSVVQALDADREGYDAFNVRDRFVSIREVASMVEDVVPDADITTVSEPDSEHYPYGTHPKLNDEKMREELRFEPAVGIERGIEKYVDTVRDEGT